MKKFILLSALAASFITADTQAQNAKAEAISKKYRFGLFANLGSSGFKVTSATISEQNGKVNYDVRKNGGRLSSGIGLTVELPVTSSASLYSGLGLDWYGGGILATRKLSDTFERKTYAKSADMKYRLQSLNIPLGLRLKASEINDKMLIYGRVGADLGLVIGRNGKYKIEGETSGPNTTIEGTGKLGVKTVNPLQFGWHFGAGVEYKIAKNAAYAEILYRNGIIDATFPQQRNAGPSEFKWYDGNIRTNNVALRVGYFF